MLKIVITEYFFYYICVLNTRARSITSRSLVVFHVIVRFQILWRMGIIRNFLFHVLLAPHFHAMQFLSIFLFRNCSYFSVAVTYLFFFLSSLKTNYEMLIFFLRTNWEFRMHNKLVSSARMTSINFLKIMFSSHVSHEVYNHNNNEKKLAACGEVPLTTSIEECRKPVLWMIIWAIISQPRIFVGPPVPWRISKSLLPCIFKTGKFLNPSLCRARNSFKSHAL